MLAYPTEDNKGKFIAIFWSIFNLGGVVGAAVSFGQNYDSSVSVVRVVVGFIGVEVSLFFLGIGKFRYVLPLRWDKMDC